MTWASDDLAQVLVAPDREHTGFAQGVIRAWNSETFENTVEVRGGTLHDLPVASGVEALTYQAGDVVMLSRWKQRSGRGSATYWIDRRVVFPGEGRAEGTISWMQGSLARAISAQVFADRTVSETVIMAGEVDGDTGTSFTDLDGPEPTGPTVQVEVTSGKLILGLGCRMSIPSSLGGGPLGIAHMSAEITGQDSFPGFWPSQVNSVTWSSTEGVAVAYGRTITIDGLQPGTYQLQAKYGANGADVVARFASRSLWAIGF